MKVEQKQEGFTPIIITLETQQEVDGLCHLLGCMTEDAMDALDLDTDELYQKLMHYATEYKMHRSGILDINVRDSQA